MQALDVNLVKVYYLEFPSFYPNVTTHSAQFSHQVNPLPYPEEMQKLPATQPAKCAGGQSFNPVLQVTPQFQIA